jgi:phosphoglycerate dehydrogenase-like enzyme
VAGVPPPKVLVGPTGLPDVESAVVAGGCVLARDATEADAVVWFGSDPQELMRAVHAGVRWVQLPDAGVEKWVAAGLLTAGRTVTAARGIYGRQVAEHALALVLACTRKLSQAATATAWAPGLLRGQVLDGREVAVVGAGGIGRTLLHMLAPLGCRTLAVNLHGSEVAEADETLPAERLDEALARADVVVLALPSTTQTKGLLGAEAFALMRTGVHVVNVGRGDLIVTDALLDALDSGKVAGVALDVTDPEPLPEGHRLWGYPQVLITPHVANPPDVKRASFVRLVEENCRRHARGDALVSVVDGGLGY